MKLSELAFACYIYSHITDYDNSYRRLLNETRPQLNLESEQHLRAMLRWLNEWGCRQFAKEYHDRLAVPTIREWYKNFGHCLPPADRTLLSLTDKEFASVEQAYTELASRPASFRKLQNGHNAEVKIGPTGAAKILFALRPGALAPWDEPVRKEFCLDESASSYRRYLQEIVIGQLEELIADCKRRQIDIANVPTLLGRPDYSVVKLVDEFFWVTISRKCPMPGAVVLKQWVSWL